MKTLNKLEAIGVLNRILKKTRNCKGVDAIRAHMRVGESVGYTEEIFTRKYWVEDNSFNAYFNPKSKALTREEVLSILGSIDEMLDEMAEESSESTDLLFVIEIETSDASYIKDNKLVEPGAILSGDDTCYNLFYAGDDEDACNELIAGFEYVLRLDATELIMQPSAEQVAASQVSQHLAQLSKLIYRDDTYLNTKQTTTNTPQDGTKGQ
ncbi:MAG: hypothetical protein RR382_00245 [Tannerellaceae bacterium]